MLRFVERSGAEPKRPDARRDPGAWLRGLQPGAIRDLAANRAYAGRLIGRWQAEMRTGPPEPDARGVAIEADVSENGLREQPQREWAVQSCQMLAELPKLLGDDTNAAAKKPDD